MVRAPILMLVVMTPSVASAGPWTRDLGQAYVKLWEGVFLSDSFIGPDGRVVAGADHISFTTALYAEVGLWDGLHLQLFAPHVVGRNTFDSGNQFLALGGGDLQAGLQWSSPWIPIPHAIRVLAKVPMYDVARPGGFEAARFPARGDGQLDIQTWLSAGGSIFSWLYAFAEIGHTFRTEVFTGKGAPRTYGDSFTYQGQIGVIPVWDIVFGLNLVGVMPYQRDDLTRGFTTLFGSIYAPVWKGLALEFDIGGVVFARNTAPGLSVGFGVSYNLQ